MSRSGKEFPSYVVDYAFRKSGGACEHCGSHDNIEVHHILPLWVAAEYFPSLISSVLKGAENAQCLCTDCHDAVHRRNDFDVYNGQALILLQAMGREFF